MSERLSAWSWMQLQPHLLPQQQELPLPPYCHRPTLPPPLGQSARSISSDIMKESAPGPAVSLLGDGNSAGAKSDGEESAALPASEAPPVRMP